MSEANFHLERFSAGVEDRVVARLDPDFSAAFGNTLVLVGIELAAAELFPEQAIFGALPVSRVDEHAVVLALDLLQAVTQRIQEVLIRGQDGAVELELDDRLRLVDRGHLAFEVGVLEFLCGDVGRELDDARDLAGAVDQRIVARLNPDFLAALGDALVLAGIELAAPELLPECPVFRAVSIGGVDEQAVMLALDLVQRVTKR